MKPFALYILVLLVMATGCTSARPGASAQWPASWDGRRAYSIEGATVYAANADAVDEVQKLLARVSREFAAKTSGAPTPGLIIITDVHDTAIGALPLDPLPPSELIAPEIRALKIAARELVLAGPIELSREQLTGTLGFSAEAVNSVAWAVALPSDKRVRNCAESLLNSTMNDPKLTVAERALMATFLPLFANCVTDTVGVARDVMIYKQFCDTQAGWEPSQRRQHFETYQSQRAPADGIFTGTN